MTESSIGSFMGGEVGFNRWLSRSGRREFEGNLQRFQPRLTLGTCSTPNYVPAGPKKSDLLFSYRDGTRHGTMLVESAQVLDTEHFGRSLIYTACIQGRNGPVDTVVLLYDSCDLGPWISVLSERYFSGKLRFLLFQVRLYKAGMKRRMWLNPDPDVVPIEGSPSPHEDRLGSGPFLSGRKLRQRWGIQRKALNKIVRHGVQAQRLLQAPVRIPLGISTDRVPREKMKLGVKLVESFELAVSRSYKAPFKRKADLLGKGFTVGPTALERALNIKTGTLRKRLGAIQGKLPKVLLHPDAWTFDDSRTLYALSPEKTGRLRRLVHRKPGDR